MIEEEWVKRQFAAAKVSQAVGTSVLRLLEVWNTMNHTDKTARETVEVFGKVAQGHALVHEPTEGMWVEAGPGKLVVGDTVRVNPDAFNGPAGQYHNGRIGRIVAIRSGDIIVTSTDDVEPVLEAVHYSPHALQKWVRV
jgi:hypothetical protein